MKTMQYKYINIYSFDVMGEIENGNTVYVVDKRKAEIFVANTAMAKDVAKATKDRTGRFEFFRIDEEET